jgi:hypothetical protein
MLQRVPVIPNEAEQVGMVSFMPPIRTWGDPPPAKRIAYVVASARLISAETWGSEVEMAKVPVTWRFLRGYCAGDDDASPGSEWHDVTVEIHSRFKDATPELARFVKSAFLATELEWYLWQL